MKNDVNAGGFSFLVAGKDQISNFLEGYDKVVKFWLFVNSLNVLQILEDRYRKNCSGTSSFRPFAGSYKKGTL